MITIILRIVWTASYMDLMLVVTQGGPAYSTLTVPLSAYYTAYSNLEFGKATAMASVQALFLLVFVIVYLKLYGKRGGFDGGR
jgi:multiple sugar transport system permease protein